MPLFSKDATVINTPEFRHRIDLQQNQGTVMGTRGEPLPNWVSVYCSVPSWIVSLAGREMELARQLVPLAQFKITTRYLTEVDSTWRIIYNGVVHNIGNVTDPDYRHRQIVMLTFTEGGL